MKKYNVFTLYMLTFLSFSLLFTGTLTIKNDLKPGKIHSSSSPKASEQTKQARWDYFHRMLRDPEINAIPKGIRKKELEFAEKLKNENNALNKVSKSTSLDWSEAGPNNVGGRTRALAVDITNPNVIIAGGASGGIWKSTDKGESWEFKSSSSTILSVTTVAQDPRPGKTNIWYYGTGEWSSNLAGTQVTSFTGDGIYKSVDNGETWTLLPSTVSSDPTSWDSQFDYVNKIEINPNTGSIFVANQGYGIFKSTDEGETFDLILGGGGHHINSDISVAADGTIVAVISSPFDGFTPSNNPGVYRSTNDGVSWTNITPPSFPSGHIRSIVEIAPSNTNVCYVLTFTGDFIGEDEDVRFHKININSGLSEDRSANMGSFPFNDGEERISQAGYNLTIAVKPDDENYVLIGATSLFRSTNGFSTKPNNAKIDWIGGYHPVYFFYPGFHPDIHAFAFDPTNPDAVWFGHDGGLSYTPDITNTGYSELFPWIDKNNGYNVTQFYHISISQSANDNRIMGGTQDNGTPYFKYNGTVADEIEDLSSGDGAYSYFGQDYAYVSSQNGTVLRLGYDGQNNPNENVNWSNITPANASNQYFINPFSVDPNDENVMYYPAGNVIWRNNQLNSIPNFQNSTTNGWTQLNNISVPSGYGIFALAVSTSPAHILYYSGSSLSGGIPKLYKLANANTSTSGAVDISIPGTAAGSYIKDIAVNPDNADEILVVMSNYNIVGLYHSINGGQSYTAVEGNLEGNSQTPGPSLRSATILPTSAGTKYYLATSIGVYSTGALEGASTFWMKEGEEVIGNVIVSYITSRKSDGKIVAGTHGRGSFTSFDSPDGNAVAAVNVSALSLQANPGGTGNTSFILRNDGDINLSYNITVNGNFSNNLPKTAQNEYILYPAEKKSDSYNEFKNRSNFRKINRVPKSVISRSINKAFSITGDDKIIHDDEDSGSDTFLGWGDGSAFDWYVEFNVDGFDYEMDSFEFFMRTEQASTNNVYVGVFDKDFNLLSEGNLSLGLSEDGDWYTINLTPSITFNDGSKFYIEIFSNSSIDYPAGTDTDAQVTGKSFYYNGSSWVNLNTISGFENGSFLIRPIGTKDQGSENLVTVNPSSGTIEPGNQQTINLTLDAQNLGEGSYSGLVNISTNGGDIAIPIDFLVNVEKLSEIPGDYYLSQNYPNPFNPETIIEFSIPSKSDVSLKVFDMLGAEVAVLVNEEKSPGKYRVVFNAADLASGIYFYNLRSRSFSETRKLILLR